MGESKHTPGPWVAEDRVYDGTGAAVIASYDEFTITMPSRGMVVYVTRPVGVSNAETVANARLCAAAPDLLEALKAVVKVADRKTVEFDLARAAIAKAEGNGA